MQYSPVPHPHPPFTPKPVWWPAETLQVLTRTEFCALLTPPGPVVEFKDNLGHLYRAENATRFEDLSEQILLPFVSFNRISV